MDNSNPPIPFSAPSPPPTPPCPSPAKPPVPIARPSQPSKRKRRRSIPPPNVTSVFSSAQLPTSAQNLWSWPAFTWYFGAVNQTDVKIANGSAFVDPSKYSAESKLPPVPTHYRLQWLEEDARALVWGVDEARIMAPEPLSSLQNLRIKETPACARQLPFAITSEETQDTDRKRRRRLRPTGTKQEPALLRNENSVPTHVGMEMLEYRPASVAKGQVLAKPLLRGSPNGRVSFVDQFVHSKAPDNLFDASLDIFVPKRESASLKLKNNHSEGGEVQVPQGHVKQESQVHSSSAVPSPTIKTLAHAMPLQNNCDDNQGNQAKTNAEMADAALPNGDHKKLTSTASSGGDKRFRHVRLQFMSPLEQKLMGTLAYLLPGPAVGMSAAAAEILQHKSQEGEGAKHEGAKELMTGAMVEGLELEFRRTDVEFARDFEDSDKRDGLGPEVVKQCSTLAASIESNRVIRNETLEVVRQELLSQNSYSQMEAEEKRIKDRLKEIALEKQIAKSQPKTRASARRQSVNSTRTRRPSLPRPASRRRRISRPTRKIREELDDEDEILPLQTNRDGNTANDHLPTIDLNGSTASAPSTQQCTGTPFTAAPIHNESCFTLDKPEHSGQEVDEVDPPCTARIVSMDLPMTHILPVTLSCQQEGEKQSAMQHDDTIPSNRPFLSSHQKIRKADKTDCGISCDKESEGASTTLQHDDGGRARPPFPSSPMEGTVAGLSMHGSESNLSNGSAQEEKIAAVVDIRYNSSTGGSLSSPCIAASQPETDNPASAHRAMHGEDDSHSLPVEQKATPLASPVCILQQDRKGVELHRVPSPVSPIQNATAKTFSHPLRLSLHLKPRNDLSGVVLNLYLNPKCNRHEKDRKEFSSDEGVQTATRTVKR